MAYNLPLEKESEDEVFEIARKYLMLMQWEKLDPYLVLIECARFYGIFLPSGGTVWEFVHKTLYDYLAAKYWAETGQFKPSAIRKWNTRAAYAASMIPDSTPSMPSILKKGDLGVFNDLLLNDPNFDYEIIGPNTAMVLSSQKEPILVEDEARISENVSGQHYHLEGQIADIIVNSTDELLNSVAEAAYKLPGRRGDVVLAQVIVEMRRRKIHPPPDLYSCLSMRFGGKDAHIVSTNLKVRLSDLKPAAVWEPEIGPTANVN